MSGRTVCVCERVRYAASQICGSRELAAAVRLSLNVAKRLSPLWREAGSQRAACRYGHNHETLPLAEDGLQAAQ